MLHALGFHSFSPDSWHWTHACVCLIDIKLIRIVGHTHTIGLERINRSIFGSCWKCIRRMCIVVAVSNSSFHWAANTHSTLRSMLSQANAMLPTIDWLHRTRQVQMPDTDGARCRPQAQGMKSFASRSNEFCILVFVAFFRRLFLLCFGFLHCVYVGVFIVITASCSWFPVFFS